jgi:hypothetical protein
MFAWPTPELTEYEKKYVRLYREPMLDANGGQVTRNGEPQFWPGVLRRMYKVSLNNVAIPDVNPYTDGPHFSQQYLATRRTRVFGLTFFGDVASWYLNIKSLSGETYTKDPCLVSSMQAGTPFDADAAIGEPLGLIVTGGGFIVRPTAEYGIMIDPNWILDQNDGLIFEGTLAPGCHIGPYSDETGESPYRILVIGIHVWEFPNMGRASNEQVEGKV